MIPVSPLTTSIVYLKISYSDVCFIELSFESNFANINFGVILM